MQCSRIACFWNCLSELINFHYKKSIFFNEKEESTLQSELRVVLLFHAFSLYKKRKSVLTARPSRVREHKMRVIRHSQLKWLEEIAMTFWSLLTVRAPTSDENSNQAANRPGRLKRPSTKVFGPKWRN